MLMRGDPEDGVKLVVADSATRRIDIFASIDRSVTLHVQAILGEFKKTRRKQKVTIVVNTRGGEALQGLAIYDLIRSSGLAVRTIILGEVASSGLAVALAGDERWMHKNAILHFHRTAMEFGGPKTVIERHESEIEASQIEVIDALYDSITLRNTRISPLKLKSLERNESYMTAPEALEFGFVHKIIDHPPLSKR